MDKEFSKIIIAYQDRLARLLRRKNSYKILSYKLKHNYDIRGFLSSYRYLLQKAIDIIWSSIEWIEKSKKSLYMER